MNIDNYEIVLKRLKDTFDNNNFHEDREKIQYLYEELKKIKEELPTNEKLEQLRKIETDLEVKYEILYDLSYYFDPLYVEIKDVIHKKMVSELREKNRQKRGGKKNE